MAYTQLDTGLARPFLCPICLAPKESRPLLMSI